ncbi:MAG: hypothetical protein Q9M12_06335, partial [Mariprofundus sp.]|nr:hypothetical protein [Mariprofundus sp.]
MRTDYRQDAFNQHLPGLLPSITAVSDIHEPAGLTDLFGNRQGKPGGITHQQLFNRTAVAH